MAATPDPLHQLNEANDTSRPLSLSTVPIAGILCDIYGLDEISASTKDVACLWLLHPRLSERKRMQPVAAAAIGYWNSKPQSKSRGLIAVAFDQRNHGSRLVDAQANEAWRSGNPRHAQDMFSIFQGTASDTSQLMTYLPSYAFPDNSRTISDNLVMGISLGGHATWHCVLHDPRVSAGVVVIGCADYVRVMADRARLSKLKTWTSSDPPGKDFLGSADFPPCLLEAVDRWDPTGLFLSGIYGRSPTTEELLQGPTEQQKARLVPLLRHHLQGKRIFNLAGGADRLVPYTMSVPFLEWMKKAIGPSGWFSGHDVLLKDKVYEGVGHDMTAAMLGDAVAFICESIESRMDQGASKM